MANILYGVNGEGAGHSTRSREIILHLQRHGHNVLGASFDRGLRNLGDICEVLEIHGFRFTYVNNQVRYNRTLARNLFQASKVTRSLRDLKRIIGERLVEKLVAQGFQKAQVIDLAPSAAAYARWRTRSLCVGIRTSANDIQLTARDRQGQLF